MTKPPTDVAEMSDSALVAKHFPGMTPSDEYVAGVTYAAEARAIESNERKQLRLDDVKAGRTPDDQKPQPTRRQARQAARAVKGKNGDVTPIPKGSSRAPQKRKEAPIKATASTSPKEGPKMATATAKRTTTRKAAPAKRAPAKATTTKRAAATKAATKAKATRTPRARREPIEVPAGKTAVRVPGAAVAVLRKDANAKPLFKGVATTDFAKGSSAVLVLNAGERKKLVTAAKKFIDHVTNLPRGEQVQSLRIARRACRHTVERAS